MVVFLPLASGLVHLISSPLHRACLLLSSAKRQCFPMPRYRLLGTSGLSAQLPHQPLDQGRL
jgi:hypothetical protein